MSHDDKPMLTSNVLTANSTHYNFCQEPHRSDSPDRQFPGCDRDDAGFNESLRGQSSQKHDHDHGYRDAIADGDDQSVGNLHGRENVRL